jgi:uncharacterized protein (TIGR03118 family)
MKSKVLLALGFSMLASAAMAGGYAVTPLVSDQSGKAPVTDSQLVNPWGLAQSSNSDPVWVSDNNSNVSTFYDRTTGTKVGVVTVTTGNPTGIVAGPGTGFDVTENDKTGASIFIFDTESGTIEGWAPSVDSSATITAYTSKHAVYKGLAYDPTTNHLFAANFGQNKVEIFDDTFKLLSSFTDTSLPKRYAPFNVALINGNLYVAFAERDKSGQNQINGSGKGYVDVFSTSGTLISHLIANGPLNAPWGLTIAPSGFGSVAGDLLVGNFGNGWINVFDPTTGAYSGWLTNAKGNPLVIDALWALDNGPGTNQITFSSGPGPQQIHGLLGLIAPSN